MFKLIKLSSNKSSFHDIVFKDGLNVIVGNQANYDKNKKNTTNGIGKSLIIKIIDFCLASEKIKEWEGPLFDWIFTLKIKVNQEEHTLSRSIEKQGFIMLDNDEKPIKFVREKLKEYAKISGDFSFREIINRFLRKGKIAYNGYKTSIKGEKDCNTLQVITYLLGLDYTLCKEKIQQKKNLDSSNALLKSAKNDPSFQTIFGIGQYDIDLELSNIVFEIERLQDEIKNKNYAENYIEVQNKANQISDRLDELSNRRFVVENNLKIINEALTREITVEFKDIEKIYQEVGVIFPEKTICSIGEVELFHQTLLQKRKETLSKDSLILQDELKSNISEVELLNKQLNECLDFLRVHSAMDKYVVAVRQIDALKTKKAEIERVANIEKDIKKSIEQLKTEISSSNIKAQTYLDSVSTETDAINKRFVSFAKKFYENKKSALSIKNNDGDNQVRFNVDARITSDGSDGIQEIITFCFDWVLMLQNITNISFIYHDSLLIANVENRQKEILFNLVNDLCGNEYQYIININQDQISGFEDSSKKIIKDNTVLSLTDKDIQSKLLGIEVDLGREIE